MGSGSDRDKCAGLLATVQCGTNAHLFLLVKWGMTYQEKWGISLSSHTLLLSHLESHPIHRARAFVTVESERRDGMGCAGFLYVEDIANKEKILLSSPSDGKEDKYYFSATYYRTCGR